MDASDDTNESLPLSELSRDEMQELIDDLNLGITVDELALVAQLLAESGDLDELREAVEKLSKAA